MLVATSIIELDPKIIHVVGDTSPEDEWTEEQFATFVKLESEYEQKCKKVMPPSMWKFLDKFSKQVLYETFAREMMNMQDKQMFVDQSDKDKDGRLNYEEFKEHINISN